MQLGDLIIRLCDVGFGAIESVRRCVGRPRVETISTSELHAAMATPETTPILVDVRSECERAVSRIPGALTQQEFEAGAGSWSGRRVVAYCTVGGRSYLFARKLVAAGLDGVNYRDGILRWCRCGLPLETSDGRPTNAVHPYWRIFRVPDDYDVRM